MTSVQWDTLQPTTIQYSIAASSEFSGRYAAENIRFDKPTEVSCRWSGTKEFVRQWILLELATVGVLGVLQRTLLVGKELIHSH